MCLVCCLDAGFGVRPAQTLSITPTLLVYVKFESRVRAQAASDLEEKTFGNFDHTFQSRVRAQAASDISVGHKVTVGGVVSIPRSGSGRFRLKCGKNLDTNGRVSISRSGYARVERSVRNR